MRLPRPLRIPSFPRLYAIIAGPTLGGRRLEEVAQALVRAGVRMIQYRDKTGSSREIFESSQAIARTIEGSHCLLFINDRADIARAVGALGAHVGQEDLPVELARRVLAPRQALGLSTHNVAQAEQAEASSADYVAIGPIFATVSKERPDPVVGLEGLRQVRRVVRKPLVAIGGITLQNAPSVLEAGADAVAVIRDLMEAPDIGRRAEEFLRALEP